MKECYRNIKNQKVIGRMKRIENKFNENKELTTLEQYQLNAWKRYSDLAYVYERYIELRWDEQMIILGHKLKYQYI